MAFTFGFYNALNHDRKYDAKEMSKIFDGLFTDGVYPTIGNRFIVRASSDDNSVIVGTGRAWFNHTWNLNDADMPISGPASHVLYPRWDAVVLDINSSDEYRTNSVMWVTGTAASTPSKPAMANTETHSQYPLAYIYRTANNNTISAADITNCVGTDECPYTAGLLVDRKNIAQYEANDYATKAYALGEYIMWRDQLYKITTAISKNAAIVPYPETGYNVTSTMIATELYEKLVFDITPTSGSNHAVTSDGIYKALGNHSSIQTTSSVTSGSSSLITSGGVYTALGNNASIQKTSSVTSGSSSLITSGGVYTALGGRSSVLYPKFQIVERTYSKNFSAKDVEFINGNIVELANYIYSDSEYLAVIVLGVVDVGGTYNQVIGTAYMDWVWRCPTKATLSGTWYDSLLGKAYSSYTYKAAFQLVNFSNINVCRKISETYEAFTVTWTVRFLEIIL